MEDNELLTDSSARWYVVYTYSGYENKVKATLEKIVENKGIQDKIQEIIIPMEEEIEIGDIFVNIDAVKTQAEEYGHSFEREFSFLFTHGVLHLLGYDHMVKEEEEVMFALQDKVLDGIIER